MSSYTLRRNRVLPLLLLVWANSAILSAQTGYQYNPRPAAILPIADCWEVPPNLGGTPLAAFVPGDPWQYYSVYSTYNSTQNITYGLLSGNFFSPGPQVNAGQPANFQPGYDKAALAIRLGLLNSSAHGTQDTWTDPITWFLHGAKSEAPLRPASPQVQNFCPTTLIPAMPVVPSSGTSAHQLLATMVAAPPAQVNVTAESFVFAIDSDPPLATLSNVYYQNGSIYGDITPSAGSVSPASWLPIRVRSGGTVLAFGHVPVLATGQCAASLSPPSIAGAQLGSPYSQTFTASNAAYTLSSTGALPPGLTFSGGTLSGTPHVPGTYTFTVFAMPADGTCAVSTTYTLVVSGQACSSDFTSQVAISFGGLQKNLATGLWTETVSFRNNGSTAIGAPIYVVVTNLSAAATLTNSQGVTQCFAPAGLPYVTYPNSLPPGGSGSVTLSFSNSQPAQPITFTPRIAGAEVSYDSPRIAFLRDRVVCSRRFLHDALRRVHFTERRHIVHQRGYLLFHFPAYGGID